MNSAQQIATGNFIAQATEQGHATINIQGFTPESLRELGLMIVEQREDAARHEQLKKLSRQLEVRVNALQGFFQTLAIEEVPDEDLVNTLGSIAQRYRGLLSRMREIRPADQEGAAILNLARTSLEAAASIEAYDDVDRQLADLEQREELLLQEARESFASAKAAVEARMLASVSARIRRAELSLTRLRYQDAADHFSEAGARAPSHMTALRASLQFREAEALYAEGKYKKQSATLRRAISLYESVLLVVVREKTPLDWATLQNSLGTALITLGERDSSSDYIGQAVIALELALEERTAEGTPREWADSMNSLGIALAWNGSSGKSPESLEASIATHRSALRIRSRVNAPEDWGQTQHNLGSALLAKSANTMDPAVLHSAVDAFRAALVERTIERNKERWSGTQNNLGNALSELGRRFGGKEHLSQALEAYDAALSVCSLIDSPLRWAQLQNNIGATHGILAFKTGEISHARKAVEHYRMALVERVRHESPLLWAETQGNLGCALGDMADLTKDVNLFRESVEAFRHALTERTLERMPLEWSKTRCNLGAALISWGSTIRKKEIVQQGIWALAGALKVRRLDVAPLERAETIQNIANGYLHLSLVGDGNAHLLQTLCLCENALEFQTCTTTPIQWAMTQITKAHALFRLGIGEPNRLLLAQAETCFVSALDALTSANASRFFSSIEGPLSSIRRRLGK
jgi:tetratricopeptide (TPR) repeat protein